MLSLDGHPTNELWKGVIHHREHFREAVFAVHSCQHTQFYRFVFAIQRPMALVMLRLQEGGATTAASTGPSVLRDWHSWRAAAQEVWCYDIGDIVDSVEVDVAAKGTHVGVYLNTSFQGAQTVASADFPELLEVVLAGMDKQAPKPTTDEPPAKKPRPSSTHTQVEMDRLEEQWEKLLPSTSAGSADTMETSAEVPEPHSPQEQQDEGAAEEEPDETLWAEVSRRRAGFDNDVCARSQDIKVALQGGAWSVKRRGTAVSEVRADVRSGTRTHACCVATHLPKSATFELNKYGERLAARLAELWVHRMAFLVELWDPSSPLTECFSAAALAGYEAPEGTEALEPQLNKVQARRLRGILALAPKI